MKELHRVGLEQEVDFITNNKIKNMEDLISLKSILGSVIYSVIGITILVIAYVIFEKITPENLRKEIIEKQNTALAIVSGSFILAIAIIIATAIHG